MIDENKKKRSEFNWQIFLAIKTLQYLAPQELALRGGDDDKSNFIQHLRLKSKTFPQLTD